VQAPLQQQLAADPEALGEERRLVEALARIAGGQLLGDDVLRIQERAQGAVGDERRRRLYQPCHLLRGADPVAPVRGEEVQLGAELLADRGLVGEEELELQQVADGEGVLPGRLDGVVDRLTLPQAQERQLHERAVDEMVQDAVAVERGHVVAAGRDRPHRFGPAVVALHDTGGDELAQRLAQPVLLAQSLHRTGDAALLHEIQQRRDDARDLLERERPVARAQQREGHQRGRRDRRGAVDAVQHAEGHLLQLHAVVPGLLQRPAQRERLTEAHLRRPDVVALGAHVVRQPAQPLAALRRADLLLGHRADLRQLVVDDRHRHEDDVLGTLVLQRPDEVPQQPEPRRAQLAGPGAAALQVPLDVEALGDEVAEVLAHGELVDRVVAEGAADEDEAGALAQRTDRPEGHVAAGEQVVAREVVLVEHPGEDQWIGVGPVRRQEDESMPAVELAQALEALHVDLHVPRPRVQRAHHEAERVDDGRRAARSPPGTARTP
jgi:hypothetical protein